MANREQERAALYKTIWSIANDLRGSVDGWDFKSYVLGLLFYRYISENITHFINKGEREAGNLEFNYENISDDMINEKIKDDLISSKGFFIYPSQLFINVVKKSDEDKNLNETLYNTFRAIESSAKGTGSEGNMKGLFDDVDVNSKKLGNTVEERNEKLSKLLKSIQSLELGDYQNNTIDAFGDTYEYLMGMYASNAGKSGGEYYTPQEVSELLAMIVAGDKKTLNKVYDPTCGSGSLLLKLAKVLGRENIGCFYGQEINITTYNLCRINMFLHDVEYDKFDIKLGNTLTNPQHLDDGPFDAIVSNPPYSTKWLGKEDPILVNDPRFSPAGVLAPKSKADLAFVMHVWSQLSDSGTAAIVSFPGVFYRDGAEKEIRKYLIEQNAIEAIIQLPGKLFYGTPIATCILVLKKGRTDKDVLFIDASKQFTKVTNSNKLETKHINSIYQALTDKKDIDHYVKKVNPSEIIKNDYNLSVSTYVEAEDTNNKIDINELNEQLKQLVAKEQQLRNEIDQIIKEIEVDNE